MRCDYSTILLLVVAIGIGGHFLSDLALTEPHGSGHRSMVSPVHNLAASVIQVATFVSTPVSLAAQNGEQCNHCGYTGECPYFHHWDNCGYEGPGWPFTGGCAGGCHYSDCITIHGPEGGCRGEDPPDLAGLTSVDTLALQLAGIENREDLEALAKLGRLERDPTSSMLFVRDCSGLLMAGAPIVPRTRRRAAVARVIIGSWPSLPSLRAALEKL